MDRSLVEADPHAIIEGMAIGAYTVGATHGFIYIRGEYPLALSRLYRALDQARDYNLLGDDIFGEGFDFDITVGRGAGAFICGEETSLIGSLEGKLPEPKVRPPYPARYGFMGKPTNINNVETWANIPHIIKNGSSWFKEIGTKSSKGTKVFSLVGKVKNTGLVEVPMGITLREIVFDIGGGIAGDKQFKAVQTGGPSGGCIPDSLLDIAVDYESLMQVGSIMGSGGMIVMDEETCMVDTARYFLSFTQEESCGKCTPCREGTRHMLDILENITEGKGAPEDLPLLEEMGKLIKETALCGLGNTAPNPVITTVKYFREEYEAHINEKRCPAKVCKSLITYSIDPDYCTGCTVCARNCPVDCISGERKQTHVIDQEKCIRCGVCRSVCNFNAVGVE
jgi:NADH:ubiquinone oxidoreductase subunit F (NADH-binding)/NAD-dependent dihydropyrimidine dehydrogenase PreA subunit